MYLHSSLIDRLGSKLILVGFFSSVSGYAFRLTNLTIQRTSVGHLPPFINFTFHDHVEFDLNFAWKRSLGNTNTHCSSTVNSQLPYISRPCDGDQFQWTIDPGTKYNYDNFAFTVSNIFLKKYSVSLDFALLMHIEL
jgi:hypothetical protein